MRDLLGSDPKARLELKESSDRGVYVKDLSQNIVKGCDHLQDLMAAGNANRTVGATLMNADSSRSHSIFMVVHCQLVSTVPLEFCLGIPVRVLANACSQLFAFTIPTGQN